MCEDECQYLHTRMCIFASLRNAKLKASKGAEEKKKQTNYNKISKTNINPPTTLQNYIQPAKNNEFCKSGQQTMFSP